MCGAIASFDHRQGSSFLVPEPTPQTTAGVCSAVGCSGGPIYEDTSRQVSRAGPDRYLFDLPTCRGFDAYGPRAGALEKAEPGHHRRLGPSQRVGAPLPAVQSVATCLGIKRSPDDLFRCVAAGRRHLRLACPPVGGSPPQPPGLRRHRGATTSLTARYRTRTSPPGIYADCVNWLQRARTYNPPLTCTIFSGRRKRILAATAVHESTRALRPFGSSDQMRAAIRTRTEFSDELRGVLFRAG